MHVASSRISCGLCFSGKEGAFPAFPVGSFPVESDTRSVKDSRVDGSRGHLIICHDDSSKYRDHRPPSMSSFRRSAKISFSRWRCRSSLKKSSSGVTTFDDFTADLYGCWNVNDELPLLDDIYMYDNV